MSSTNELSDRRRFRSYYQLLPSDSEIATAFQSIIQQYRWRRVAFIVQNEPEFVAVSMIKFTCIYTHFEFKTSKKVGKGG